LCWRSPEIPTRRALEQSLFAAFFCATKKDNFILIARFCGRGRLNPRKIYWSLVDPHDLGTLEAETGHQTLLIESEGVDAAMNGAGGEAPGHSFVHDDDARAGADLPDTQPTRHLTMPLMLRCCDNGLGIIESAS
jgi:hypothetical protein